MKTLKLFLIAGATVLILLLTPQPAGAQSAGCNLIYQSGANSDAEPPGAPDGDCPRALPAIGSAVSLALALILVLLAAFRSFALGALPGEASDAAKRVAADTGKDAVPPEHEEHLDAPLAEVNAGNLKNVTPQRVARATGLNPEEIKAEYLGNGAPIARYDLKRDPASGFLVIVEKRSQRILEVTGYKMDSG